MMPRIFAMIKGRIVGLVSTFYICIMETFSSYLKHLRQSRRLSLGQLSLRSGINKSTLSRWESGKYYPRIPELGLVTNALRASVAEQAMCLRLLEVPRAILAERNTSGTATRLSLGDLLFGLRQRSGMAQDEVARLTGISRSLYSQWETDTVRPTTEQLHAVAYSLGASGEEILALSSEQLSETPLEKSRDSLLECYRETMQDFWGASAKESTIRVNLLSLLIHFSKLTKLEKASNADVALIVTSFGNLEIFWNHNTEKSNFYYDRAYKIANTSQGKLHFHVIPAVGKSLLNTRNNASDSLNRRISTALKWQSRFPDKAGQAYLLSFIAGALVKEAPEESLRLADVYCDLVADDPSELPCRQRDKGNLLSACGCYAESVAFIAALKPPDTFREGLQQLDMADGLVALGSKNEARTSLDKSIQILSQTEVRSVHTKIRKIEHALSH
jgi:transcriptional regulator with XRE-family HTH domain